MVTTLDRWQEEGACKMLVLSRHRDESIIIGDDIVITVVDIRGDKVRLGIAAPIEISVHRQEVYEAIQRENRQASRLEPQEARQVEAVRGPIRRDFKRLGATPAHRIQAHDVRRLSREGVEQVAYWVTAGTVGAVTGASRSAFSTRRPARPSAFNPCAD